MTSNAEIGRLMRLQMVALSCAVDDVAAGRYSQEERDSLARGLDVLARALRDQDAPVVIEVERAESPVGFVEWGSIT